jgi:hypothetical protein
MTEEVNTTETEVSTEEQQVQLSLKDIATMVQIIDICSKRGGFEGPELEAVGGLRNRIVTFLNAASKGAENVPEGEVPVAEESESESE